MLNRTVAAKIRAGERTDLRELVQNLIGEGAVLVVDEGGVHPAALVRRLVRHHSVLVHVRLEEE